MRSGATGDKEAYGVRVSCKQQGLNSFASPAIFHVFLSVPFPPLNSSSSVFNYMEFPKLGLLLQWTPILTIYSSFLKVFDFVRTHRAYLLTICFDDKC